MINGKYIIAALALATTVSCTKIDNGNLDGFWMLTSVDTLATGGNRSMDEERVFWAIQGKMVEIGLAGEAYPYDFIFEKTGNALSFSHGIRNWRDKGDLVLQDSDLVYLAPLGVHNLTPTFDIQSNSRNHLILKDGQFRLKFKKF